jgi:hypothetical protein
MTPMDKAAEVMARMKNGKNQVVVLAYPPGNGTDPASLKGKERPMTRKELREALLAEFGKGLNLDACAIAHDQNGQVIRGSVFVVAVVPTEEEVDLGLLGP